MSNVVKTTCKNMAFITVHLFQSFLAGVINVAGAGNFYIYALGSEVLLSVKRFLSLLLPGSPVTLWRYVTRQVAC